MNYATRPKSEEECPKVDSFKKTGGTYVITVWKDVYHNHRFEVNEEWLPELIDDLENTIPRKTVEELR